MEINNTDFPISITNEFKKLLKTYNPKKEFLRSFQYITKNYIINSKPDFRGILLYHTVGMGKTFTAVSIAEYYRTLDKDRKIVILSAKSLASNFYNTIIRYMIEVEELNESEVKQKIENDYRFVSSNASNMIQQLRNIREVKRETIIDKISKIVKMHNQTGFLENSLLIVDEAHNIFNSITNGSKQAVEFYDIILKTKNIKLIFLTGTPIVNSPFEIVPCINMLFGYSFLPEVEEDFTELFVDEGNLEVKNKGKLTNYLMGLISYYGEMFSGGKTRKGFPMELNLIIEDINMSQYQYVRYNNARVLEQKEAQRGIKGVPSRFGIAGTRQSTTYRIKTRQISNFAFPENIFKEFTKKAEIIKEMKDKKEVQKKRKRLKKDMVEQLTTDNLSMNGLKIYSPKMLKIISNINKEMLAGKNIGVVYSEFVSAQGIAVFAKILKTLNWHQFDVGEYVKSGGTEALENINICEKIYKNVGGEYTCGGKQQKIKKQTLTKGNYTFAIISGDVSSKDRDNIKDVLNSPDNINGEIINLLLMSSTGAEGLDLKGIRHIHIMEPYWNMARIHQIKARGIRFMSHEHLPVENRNVQAYIYLSIYPKNISKSKAEEPTTDKYMYNRAINNQIIIDKFLTILIESSVDCAIHKDSSNTITSKSIHCKLCRPTNKPLYYNKLREDLSMVNTCTELEDDDLSNLAEQVTAKELVLEGGKKVYYTIDPPGGKSSEDEEKNILSRIHVYEYRPSLEGYTPLESDSSYYPQIMEKIMQIID